MVNPVKLLEARKDKANFLLKKKKVGVTIYIRNEALFLRAYLPSKVKPNWDELTQQWVSLGLKVTTQNIKKAASLAEDLGAERASRLFDWRKWLDKEDVLVIKPKQKSYRMKDIFREFETWYWNQADKSKNNTSNLKGFDHIKNYLNRLDEQKILNLKNVIAIAEEYPENSKSRMEIAKQFFRLAKFANIPELKKFEEWAIPTQQAYKPKKRERLSDADYFEKVKELRDDPQWGWPLAAMFVFGCRITEVWSVKPEVIEDKIIAEILTIPKAKKPDSWRVGTALMQEWAKELNIMDVGNKEFNIVETEDYDGKKVKSVNDRFHKWMRKNNAGFQLTDLRHAYGYRCGKLNINTASASRWMGHSERVHKETYQAAYGKTDIIATLKNLNL